MNPRMLVVVLGLLPSLGCDGGIDGQTQASDIGVLELALSAADQLGHSWRLSGAEFEIKDASGETVDTLVDPDGVKAVQRRKLEPGSYSVLLKGAWVLSRVVGESAEAVDAEVDETEAIPFEIEAGRTKLVTYHFRLVKQGAVGIGMEVVDNLPVITANFTFTEVDETEPYLGELVGTQAAFSWSFEAIDVDRHPHLATNDILYTEILGTESTLELEPDAPQRLVDIFGDVGIPSPLQGAFDPTIALTVTLSSGSGGRLQNFFHAWGHEDLHCVLFLIPTTGGGSVPLDDDDYPVLVPFEIQEGLVQLQCWNDTRTHQALGTAAFGVQ